MYAEFAEWCEDSAANLRQETKVAQSQVDDLTETIGKEVADQQALISKIDDVGADIASDEKELAAATKRLSVP